MKCIAWIPAAIALLLGPPAFAEPYDALKPLLVDLPGWEADAAEGMAMQMQGVHHVQAMREYRQGDRRLQAVLLIGGYAQTLGGMQDLSWENESGRMRARRIDGFRVVSTFDKRERSGSIVVGLAGGAGQGAIFSLAFSGMTDEDALALARRFDWQAMRRIAQAQIGAP